MTALFLKEPFAAAFGKSRPLEEIAGMSQVGSCSSIVHLFEIAMYLPGRLTETEYMVHGTIVQNINEIR